MGFRLMLVNKTNRINVKHSNTILKNNKSYQNVTLAFAMSRFGWLMLKSIKQILKAKLEEISSV